MTHSSFELLDRYERGDGTAADQLFERYADRLLALASRLSTRLARRIDADDVVQSTYRSFFARARRRQFDVDAPGDLWRLLATIALHKVHRQARRHRAARRSIDRENSPDAAASLDHIAANSPSPEDIVAVGEEFDWLLNQLSPSEGKAIQLRWQGLTVEQVAHALSRSERTVRRWLTAAHELLTARWTQSATDDLPAPEPNELAIVPSILDLSADVMPLRHAEYHLERLIGAGGICKVYVAREKANGRRVAIKVLRKHLQRRAEIVARFVKEAEIVRRLAHPRIVPVHGLGRLPRGGCFMVMDYIDGSDLEHVASGGALEPRRAADLVALVSEAVQHAHEHGVVHRDLKPGNVLLDRDENVYVSDFGFAWLHTEGQEDTAIVGTAGYMAPEQIDPARGPIGPWTDVYGLGALLFKLLTGHAAREAMSADDHQMGHGPVLNALQLHASLLTREKALARIVSCCLATDWRERFASASELGQALRETLLD